MKLHAFLFFIVVLVVGCKANDPHPDLEADLKSTMQNYLYGAVNNDSSNVKYRVEDVVYFTDKEKYICDFTVNVKAKLFDTTGIMRANISKDFKTVTRIF